MGEALITRRGGGSPQLVSINITIPPTKTVYITGDTFDSSGMVVMAGFTHDIEQCIVTDDCTFTPDPLTTGTSSVTVSYTYGGVTKTAIQAVTVYAADPVLANNTWETIAVISAGGQASDLWSVGDVKSDTINGTSYEFQIIGFNHDDLNSTDTKYDDSNYNSGTNKAGITFQMKNLYATTYQINSGQSNVGGWDESYMRTTVMPLLKGYLTSDLRNVLRTVTKRAGRRSSGSTPTYQVLSADTLFLLAEKEVYGTTNYTVYEGERYAFYVAGNSPIKKKGTTNTRYWLRSPKENETSKWCSVESGGTLGNWYANNENGVSFAFCV